MPYVASVWRRVRHCMWHCMWRGGVMRDMGVWRCADYAPLGFAGNDGNL
ncbi:hypothetical protein HMPREF3231_01181 [Bifidobacterium longum]|nr:hypothetical protein HMPREF3231_01181 [Bifidobacterium longum]